MGAGGIGGDARDVRYMHEGQHLEAARGDDFIGVQAYSRTRLDEHGKPIGAEEGVETLDMGYEYWPQALEVAIRLPPTSRAVRST